MTERPSEGVAEADVWGRIYLDHWAGVSHPHTYVSDDGVRNDVPDAAGYFDAPRSDAERRALNELSGRVLDLGCGPGSYALYLEERCVHVVAIDSSEGAIDVCRRRGCADARVADLSDPGEEGLFDAIVCMGNTIGIGQDPSTLPTLLRGLRGRVRLSGCLILGMLDPLMTDVPNRLEYHERNRARGLPPALVRAHLEYRGVASEEWTLWLPTESELRDALEAAGWRVDRLDREGAKLLWTLMPSEDATLHEE
ncbi:MAG: methyltransferase domain-containing protein [Gemmatimonadota bacterium]